MLDTNIFVYYVSDKDSLTRDVANMLSDYDNQLFLSMESVRELIVAFRTKKLLQGVWDTPNSMVASIEEDFGIGVLPVDMSVMKTYASLDINTAQDHKDPSDHVIIAHAITLGIPLVSSDRKFPFYKTQRLDLIENW